LLERALRAAFGRRRKMLRQAMAGTPTGLTPAQAEAALAAAGIDGRRRGETLSLAEFARLARALPPPTPTATPDAEVDAQVDN
jgi:16S rRNA (adenine1518-N6/adenine1519-N6)-dimethyltransferase